MNKNYLFIYILSFSFFLFSQETNAGIQPFGLSLGGDEFSNLLEGEYMMDRMDRNPTPLHIPDHELTHALYNRFPIAVYGDILQVSKRSDSLSDEQFLLQSVNTFLRFTEQKGIEYFSDNHGNITLINDSYTLNEKLKKTGDEQLPDLPGSYTTFAYQKDYYFSGNRFQYDITSADGGVRIKTTNLTDMRVKGIFKAIDKNRMNMEFYILTDGEYFCVYGIALVEGIDNPVEAFGMRVDIPSAMSKRMRSIIGWFLESIS